MLTHTRVWSRREKWLIVAAVVLGLTTLGAIVFNYERYYRGPSDNILVGTWVHQPATGESLYYDFRPDGKLVVLDPEGLPTGFEGKWYAGGPTIYVRFPPGVLRDRELAVWHIVDISPNQFRVRVWRDREPMIYERVKPPKRI